MTGSGATGIGFPDDTGMPGDGEATGGTGMTDGGEAIVTGDIEVAGDDEPGRECPRCRTGEVLAVLRRPHTWTNASGRQVRGTSEVLLCARCDAGDPLGGPIVAYFARHPVALPEHVPELARLLRRWIGGTPPAAPSGEALRSEADAWHRGEL